MDSNGCFSKSLLWSFLLGIVIIHAEVHTHLLMISSLIVFVCQLIFVNNSEISYVLQFI